MTTDIFFILTVIFVAYVIYQRVEKLPIKKTPPLVSPIKTPSETQKVTQNKHPPAATQKIELRTVLMKNPKTGEQAKVASNYRMAKRWVKEALVEEKLLTKIYKNNELSDNKIIIADALATIKAMDKYKV